MNNQKHILPDETFEDRITKKAEIRKAAAKGNPIAGALCSLEVSAHEMGLGFMVDTAQDYADENEDDEFNFF